MHRIFDNINGRNVDKAINEMLCAEGVRRADFCVGYFNLRGWKLVAENIENLPGGIVKENDGSGRFKGHHRTCRLLIGMHSMPQQYVREMFGDKRSGIIDNEASVRLKRALLLDLRRQLTIGFQKIEDERALQLLQKQLQERKVVVKVHLRHPLHAKLYLVHSGDADKPVVSVMGSSNLTFNGLCRNGELNAEFIEREDSDVFDKWFTARWEDKFSLDVTDELIKVLDESWASLSKPTPYEIYLKIMYHLGREASCGIAEYQIPHVFASELYDFQKTAVQLILRHLKKRGGAMLGDVVGLGKTISACAVAKYYEERIGASTLLLCPPNLIDMWQYHVRKYDLKMDVMSMAAALDPRKMRFYKLVVVDESHNLRNGGGKRYSVIRDLIQYQDNDVLLLTATPFNKDYSDISAQLKLFIDPDEDLGMRPERAIRELKGEQLFVQKYPEIPIGSLRAFDKSEFPEDWRELLKLYLVRRTRTFIKNNYALSDENDPSRKYLPGKNGSRNYFPERLPKSVTFETKRGDSFERLYCEKMMDWIADMSLPRYGLSTYVGKKKETAPPKVRELLDNLTAAGRRLRGFCRSGFCKRMDSSGVVFLMSLYRHAVRNSMFLYAIKNKLDLPIRAGVELDEGWIEDEDSSGETIYSFPTEPAHYAEAGKDAYERLKAEAPASVRWISSEYFENKLKKKLTEDNEIVMQMLSHCGAWKPAADNKLAALKKLVASTHANEKVLVFTQYKDTARYLEKELNASGVEAVDRADGDTENMTERVMRFSPLSNNCTPPPANETRVLVATDTLSEGQNLQDAHIVINYDLPWAIIRLIQRAGRVDRIGQKAKSVLCYSFFPQEGVDRIIHLTDRLNKRINANADAVGSDEVFFEGNKKNLKDVFNEKAGVLDDENDDGEVDIASQAYQVWQKAIKGNPKLEERVLGLANVVYNTKAAEEHVPGVITYAQTASGNDVLSWVARDGSLVSNSFTEILGALECKPETPAVETLENHHELVRKAVTSLANAEISHVSMGAMGSKKTARYRLFDLLQIQLKQEDGSLFAPIWQRVANDVFQYPLREHAKTTIMRLFAKGETAGNILETARKLHAEDQLCAKPADDSQSETGGAQIICSLGLSEEK